MQFPTSHLARTSPENNPKTMASTYLIYDDITGAKGAERLTEQERAELQELIGQAPVTAPLPTYGKEQEPFA